jgi:tight adherence protein C
MITTIAVILAFITTALLVIAAYFYFTPQTTNVVERLDQIRQHGVSSGGAAADEKISLGETLRRIVIPLGRIFQPTGKGESALRRRLGQAGFYGESAVINFNGLRVLLAVGLLLVMTVVLTVMRVPVAGWIFAFPLLAMVGLFMPSLVLDFLISGRKDRITRGLADAVDLMVACVEAGLSLNAALVRVASDLKSAQADVALEFELCGLEIRAGKTREEAFRNLGARTGVKDLKSFAAMLIQTDRFGTSIARALRVFADSLRTKRRQRAEEQAAKTTIKLVFPLVFFIFPAILVVLLGPGMIRMMEVMSTTLK